MENNKSENHLRKASVVSNDAGSTLSNGHALPQKGMGNRSSPEKVLIRRRHSIFSRRKTLHQLLNILKEEEINVSQLEPEDFDELVGKNKNMDDHWRKRLDKLLHSLPVAVIIVILVVLDCAFVIGELYIDISIATDGAGHSTPCRTHNQTTPHSVNMTRSDHGGSAEGHHDVREHIAHGLHIGSLTILSLFCFEILLRFVGMGPRRFFKSKVEVIDAVVILASLVMDVVALFEWGGMNLLAFLFVMLLWRFIRIVNTLLATYKRRVRLRYDLQRIGRRRAEIRLKETAEKLRRSQEELKNMTVLAEVRGATTEEIQRCKPAAKTRSTRETSSRYDTIPTEAMLKNTVLHLMGITGTLGQPAEHSFNALLKKQASVNDELSNSGTSNPAFDTDQ